VSQTTLPARPAILLVDSGSSSVKDQLLDMAGERARAGDQVERAGTPPSRPHRRSADGTATTRARTARRLAALQLVGKKRRERFFAPASRTEANRRRR